MGGAPPLHERRVDAPCIASYSHRPCARDLVTEGAETFVEPGRVVPERRMSRRRYDVHLGVADQIAVLLDRFHADDGVAGAMRDQHRPADRRQQVVVVESAGEEALPDEWRYRGRVAEHAVELRGCRLADEAQP